MKTVFFITALLSGLSSICFAEDSPPKSIDSMNTNESDIKSTFIARLLKIANSGKLFEPTEIAHMLDLNFEATSKEIVLQPAGCKVWNDTQSVNVTTFKVLGDTWFRPHQPSAVYLMAAPAMVVPAMDYEISHNKYCSESRNTTSASLEFNGLHSFSCITLEDVKKLLPKAKLSCGYYEYSTKKPCALYSDTMENDTYGSRLAFKFSEDDVCVRGATIKQNQEFGWRYKRAQYKFQTCLNRADQDLCDNHFPITWEEMWGNRNKTCGKFDSYYEKEPLTGEAPESLPDRNYKLPQCAGL